jgi:hypothetical protein
MGSRTIQGAVIAAVSEVVRAWSLALGWSDATSHAALATVTAIGLVWSVIGLRKAVDK